MNGKAPIYLTVVVLGLLAAALLWIQPYGADWPGTAYTQPAKHYIRTAIQQDSAGLARLSTSAVPVAWALRASRKHPETLALWAQRAEAWTGRRLGDTAEVFVYPMGDVCHDAPIIFRFVGAGRQAKVIEASSSCLDPG